MPKRASTTRAKTIRLVAYALLFGLLLWLIARQHTSLEQALQTMQHANLQWLAVSVIAMGVSLLAAATVYVSLALKPLRFGRTVLVQAAGFCMNKLLPSGSGAAGTSFLYLRANRMTTAQAAPIVVLNNLLGFAGHFILFWVLLLLQPSVVTVLQVHDDTLAKSVELVLAAFVLLAGLSIVLRAKLGHFMEQLAPVLNRPAALAKALLASMGITLCYVLSLYASAHAVGTDLSMAGAIIALSGSVLATSVVPTPGGIGAAELGAYGGLVALGIDAKSALAAALLYRVCTFWLPLVFGSIAFFFVVRRGYLRPMKTSVSR
ncbi:MAG: lysylphosphatidylglycerol synthase transmembrane domain-containing protein [Candidatus Saccharimonadales bacterium]